MQLCVKNIKSKAIISHAWVVQYSKSCT